MNYHGKDHVVVDTPLIEIVDMVLIDEAPCFRILVKAKLVAESSAGFRELMTMIDDKLVADAGFVGSQRFWPTVDASGTLSFFVPVYDQEVNIKVIDDKQTLSVRSLHRGVRGKLMILLSHVESTAHVYFPVWNVVQIRIM